jgi:hypothetical protein
MARRGLRARVNWAARWGGVAVGVITAAIYIASSLRCLVFHCRGPGVEYEGGLYRGSLGITRTEDLLPRSGRGPHHWSYTITRPMKGSWSWSIAQRPRFSIYRGTMLDQREAVIPLWIAPAAVAPLSVSAWVLHRRVRPMNSCPSCNYDLSGLPTGSPCPECAAHPSIEIASTRSIG